MGFVFVITIPYAPYQLLARLKSLEDNREPKLTEVARQGQPDDEARKFRGAGELYSSVGRTSDCVQCCSMKYPPLLKRTSVRGIYSLTFITVAFPTKLRGPPNASLPLQEEAPPSEGKAGIRRGRMHLRLDAASVKTFVFQGCSFSCQKFPVSCASMHQVSLPRVDEVPGAIASHRKVPEPNMLWSADVRPVSKGKICHRKLDTIRRPTYIRKIAMERGRIEGVESRGSGGRRVGRSRGQGVDRLTGSEIG